MAAPGSRFKLGFLVTARLKASRRVRRHANSRSLTMFCGLVGLLIVLGILAALEFKWAGVVGEAHREAMQAKLLLSLVEIRTDLDNVLLSLREGLEPTSFSEPAAYYAHRLELWRRSVTEAGLVANVYKFDPGSGRLLKWNWFSKQFESALPSQRLAPLVANLRSKASQPGVINFSRKTSSVWISGDNTPVLISLLPPFASSGSRSYLWVELPLQGLKHHLFPQIFRRRLAGGQSSDYRICLISGHKREVLYESGSSGGSGTRSRFDAELTFLGEASSAPHASDYWELAVARRQGTSEAMEVGMPPRWLIINSAALLILALGIATITGFVLRAQAFLRLQMEFVASVSHELRTPLSVIGSAADNLAEGIVRSESGVREYGSLIRSECRRLSGLVDQTLHFAAGKADYRSRKVRFLRVAELIDKALADQRAVIEASGFTVEKNIDPGLPMIRIDPDALSECLLNLVSNAVKYGGETRWIGIRAQALETGRGTGVQITVADRGLGIPAEEVAHIFEPFYRGRAARSAQIRGTGLGLSLAHEAASSMGARITVESVWGKGSAFTIHVPAAFMNSSTIPVEAMVES